MTGFELPRLAIGDHQAESGVGCVMNLMCWVKQERVISDEPAGYLDDFRDLLIGVNDNMCAHLTYELNKFELRTPLNCPDCSIKILEWAFALDHSDWLEDADIAMDDNLAAAISRVVKASRDIRFKYPISDHLTDRMLSRYNLTATWEKEQYELARAALIRAMDALVTLYQEMDKQTNGSGKPDYTNLAPALQQANFAPQVYEGGMRSEKLLTPH